MCLEFVALAANNGCSKRSKKHETKVVQCSGEFCCYTKLFIVECHCAVSAFRLFAVYYAIDANDGTFFFLFCALMSF